MTAALGGQFCRVLSGQRRPEVSREDGLRYAADCIRACLPHAADRGVTLVIENHYKDGYWQHPEFAQQMDVFCDLVDRVGEHPNFGVNYDPSNTILAGEDPLELLAPREAPRRHDARQRPLPRRRARSKTSAARRTPSATPTGCGTARSARA